MLAPFHRTGHAQGSFSFETTLGASLCPRHPAIVEVPSKQIPNYLDSFPAVAVNAGMLVGHNTLRLMVMGLEDRAPTAGELDQMCALLDEGLSAGALPPHQAADRYRQLGDLMAQGRLHPVIDRILPLSEVATAHRLLEQRQHFGKILLTM